MAPQFSSGLNMPSKNPTGPKTVNPLGQKRKKNIFDDDSDDDDKKDANGAVEVSTLGGLDAPASKSSSGGGPPPKRKMQLGVGSKPNLKPLNKGSIFADDEDEDEEKDKERQGGIHLGLNQAQSKRPPGPTKDFINLSALHSSKKHAKEAEELDPSIYSYDTVYDSLHAKPEKSTATEKSETPKYMTSLLRSAEIRKRDQLRARDRQLAKEREAEGDEFADKESFVTGAYKTQQAEMRKVEEEEARREKEEEERRKQNGNAGMVNFYRDVLSRGEAQHEEKVKAAEEAARRVKAGEAIEDTTKEPEEQTEAQKAADLNARGAHIAVNEEGQVVDKRQLLSAGLNVAPKPKAAPSAAPVSRPSTGRPGVGAGYQSGRGAQRARQTEMIAQQLEDRARQEEEAEAAKQKEIAEKNRSRKTTTDVSSAKERYLARKREREEAAAKEKAGAK
ncbi:uncharacterized protein N7459_001910 [Penicillium hispanicum]|uniref:uncharacterized protein n=1 Tax=Penicillium hispanicum TaxID=1080232 RepID=UPI00253F93F2|nr:uncharacterized protein N7459_001910 [Penicillium hispanicum]KAJ5591541.1 hypothetical protein N7459_001910 [Penicillium hispanicum]